MTVVENSCSWALYDNPYRSKLGDDALIPRQADVVAVLRVSHADSGDTLPDRQQFVGVVSAERRMALGRDDV